MIKLIHDEAAVCFCDSKSYSRCRASSRLHPIKTKAKARNNISCETFFPSTNGQWWRRLEESIYISRCFATFRSSKKSNAVKCATLASCFSLSRFSPYSAQGTTKISAKIHETLVFFKWNYLFAFSGCAITENYCEANNEHHRWWSTFRLKFLLCQLMPSQNVPSMTIHISWSFCKQLRAEWVKSLSGCAAKNVIGNIWN